MRKKLGHTYILSAPVTDHYKLDNLDWNVSYVFGQDRNVIGFL
jgi:hypothetical protein